MGWLRREVRWWADDAAYDLATAHDLARLGRWSHVVFLARQAVEKMLKACHLHILRAPAPREHNLRTLARLVASELPEEVAFDLDWLNPHYTPTRYVDAAIGPPSALYDRALAREALRRAEEVLAWLQQWLA